MRKIISIITAFVLVFLFVPQMTFASGGSPTLLQDSIKVDLKALKDVSVEMNTDRLELDCIKNGTSKLIPGTDYIISGNTVLLKKGYLTYYFGKFPSQNLYLNFNFGYGFVSRFTVYGGSSPDPELVKVSEKFNLENPCDIKFPLELNGNFITSTRHDRMDLVQRIDYTYSNDTRELIIRKGYLAGKFAKCLEPLTLDISFTGDKFKSIEIVPYGYICKGIAAGESEIAALKEDGTVVAWGGSMWGESTVPEDLKQVKAIAAGGCTTYALKEDGTVAAWGAGFSGQRDVPEGLTGVKAIFAGYQNAAALKEDGTVVIWGSNTYSESHLPIGVDIVKQIAFGAGFTLALKEDGTVAAWGYNEDGRHNVPAGLSGVKSIAAGLDYGLALKEDGTVVAWGKNEEGQCNVPAGLKGVKSIVAGRHHAAALKEDGTVVAWGRNDAGQCNIPEGLKGVKAIATTNSNTVILMDDGTISHFGSGILIEDAMSF